MSKNTETNIGTYKAPTPEYSWLKDDSLYNIVDYFNENKVLLRNATKSEVIEYEKANRGELYLIQERE